MPTLNSFRTLTTYLLLAALLISNAAGWVHVGCCESEHVAASKTEPKARLCSCKHHCNASAEAEQDSAPTVPLTDDEHDSDRCNVCQNFFASREAMLVVDIAPFWTPLATERLGVATDDASIEPIFLNGLAVRGPPSA